MKIDLHKFVKNRLTRELEAINNSNRKSYCEELDEFEKAIIYYYTEEGYESLNETLRNGEPITELGEFLNYSLSKLPDYRLLCYRTMICSKLELKKYYKAFNDNSIVLESSFLSCSKSKLLSLQFSESPLFVIKSKRGKEIEKIAKFGIDSGQNEKEVLFRSNSSFKVLDIKEENNKIVITLEEV
jgi:hypothetical protein